MQGEKREADLSEFIKLSRPRRKPCPIFMALAKLTKEEEANLKAACAADRDVVNDGAIVEWLEGHGITVNIPAVTSHRHSTCTCRCYD